MKLRDFTATPDPLTAAALAEFEKQFSYPLGDTTRFHLSHQPDYLRFFQAIGQAHLLVAEQGGGVLGSLVTVARSLSLDGQASAAHYFCDLKVRPSARGSRVLANLFAATQSRIRASASLKCYGIVMGGTDRRPSDYTGRLDTPLFPQIAEIAILRLTGSGQISPAVTEAAAREVAEIHRGFSRPGYTATGGNHDLRSGMTPVGLRMKNGAACGIVEDTRRAKRLLVDDGSEMLSAHLSSFAFVTPTAGAELLEHALAVAQRCGLPALFVAIPASSTGALVTQLERSGLTVSVAPAAIFGHDLEAGRDWWVDTAEI
ncbi:MAG: hypothetical protein JWO82_2665 [Akkermansiaceae bacterium]|nr:hypothetical protein [Akkermansiaceae bacterium]